MYTQLSYASGHDDLFTDVKTTIKRPPSRRPQYRCKHNYQTLVVTMASIQMQAQLSYASGHDGLYADVNTTIIRPPSRRPICRYKHNYQTPASRWHLYRCKHNYHTPAGTTTSIPM